MRLVATDLGFSAGVGPDVRAAGEALLMAIAGRRGVVGELSGPASASSRAASMADDRAAA